MKSPLGKLRKFYRHDSKDKKDFQLSAQLDELAQASKDMQEIRNCYDSLLSAAAATANSAYEFSESLQEMGGCLMEKVPLQDDEESGNALLMLGKVQYELQKLVDSYRAHIFVTITNPSESLLNELRTVEEMKRQCDEKRSVYDYMLAQQKEKGKPKSGKIETFTPQQLRAAHEAYDEEATLCLFRLKSLKQGQSRSLLTQAARHHAAQLNFFRKGLKSLEAVEPHVRLVTERQHIEHQFSGLEDSSIGESGRDDGGNGNDYNEDGELSFDYRPNKQVMDFLLPRDSLEMDEDVALSPRRSKVEDAEMLLDRDQGDIKIPSRENRVTSYSAPIYAEKKFDPAEKARQLLPLPARKSHTYVLPTPRDAKVLTLSRNSTSSLQTKPSGQSHNIWHSSPLDQKKHEQDHDNDGTSHGPHKLRSQLTFKENSNKASALLHPLNEGLALPQLDNVLTSSDSKKIKRQAFSGPLTSRPSSTKPHSSSSGPIGSPRLSPNASPPLASSPKISELHELPRPPGGFGAKASRSPSLIIGHSAPLGSRNQELGGGANRISMASPLPTPPLIIPRSFSIPSSSQRDMALHVAKRFESPQQQVVSSSKGEDVASPPLTPISLSNVNPIPIVSDSASQSSPIRGEHTVLRSINLG